MYRAQSQAIPRKLLTAAEQQPRCEISRALPVLLNQRAAPLAPGSEPAGHAGQWQEGSQGMSISVLGGGAFGTRDFISR